MAGSAFRHPWGFRSGTYHRRSAPEGAIVPLVGNNPFVRLACYEASEDRPRTSTSRRHSALAIADETTMTETQLSLGRGYGSSRGSASAASSRVTTRPFPLCRAAQCSGV